MENKEIKIQDGITLYCMKTDKFKTNYIVFNILSKLSRDTVTMNSLLPLVLRRGSINFPTMKDISVKLEDMFGASFDANTDKIGDRISVQFIMDMISDEYTLDKSELLRDGVELISEILLKPLTEDGHFKKEYVDQEKDTLKEIINSKINDKASYAMDRTVEEMYKDEPYGLYKFGYVEDLEKIDEKNLYEYYLKLLQNAEIQIYVSGNFDELSVADDFSNYFEEIKRNYKEDKTIEAANILNQYKKIVSKEKEVTDFIEHQNVAQGKLVFGYRLNSDDLKKDFYAMNVYSAILGGTASSKLFNNVREKKSLAYTIRSQYIKHKGALFVSAGIELENFEIAKECILKEINDMKIGEITEEEIHDAKVNLETRFKSFNDSQAALIGWALGQNLLEGDIDLSDVINKINAVTKEDIVDAASRLSHDFTYYLAK